MPFETELQKIIEKRKAVYRLDWPIVTLLLLAGISQTYLPFFTPLMAFTAFVLFYRKLSEAAHMPCPQCLRPFGTKSKYVLSVGSDQCQNCKLNLYGN